MSILAPKTIIVSVTNDLASDQRVHKVCSFLQNNTYNVLLVGRLLPSSPTVDRSYATHRFKLLFTTGALFYAEYNLRLFIYLLFKKWDCLLANDLDTLLANYLAHKCKGGELYYDTHEYFTEVPELAHNPFAKNTWLKIEQFIFPKLKTVYTVNASIANIYTKLYGNNVHIVRNIPVFMTLTEATKTRKELGFTDQQKIIILQGAGINIDRGAEEAVLAMKHLPNNYVLLIIGSGDAIPTVQHLITEHNLQQRVQLLPRIPYADLMHYTRIANVGITLDKDTNLNYKYSLPNKLFDYIHAGIPIVSSNLIELTTIIRKYNVGEITPSHTPQDIANTIEKAANTNYTTALLHAKSELQWQNECKVLTTLYCK
ncbi:MAG: glycosyltransferase [Bacteroidia bacterium]|nr:glycosyltransferase [Bacteroidia bacterium]